MATKQSHNQQQRNDPNNRQEQRNRLKQTREHKSH